MKKLAILLSLKYEEIQNILPTDSKIFMTSQQMENRSLRIEEDFGSINHPVHIVKSDDILSPSAFIPFCEFGGNMKAMGVQIDQFDVPVCNSFQAKILNDQLCYEVDLNRFTNKTNIKNELELGFSFIMDYNEDRQVRIEDVHTKKKEAKTSFVRRIDESDSADGAYIYLD